MAISYLKISAICTVISLCGLQWSFHSLLAELESDGLTGERLLELDNSTRVLELLSSHSATAFLANFALNLFVLAVLCLKTFFFGELSSSEARKLLERLINYVIYKGTFLPLVIPPTLFQLGLWCIWLTVLCSLKMFQALARDRLERLNASPSTTPWTYFLVYSVLQLVLFVDCFWIVACLTIYQSSANSLFILLFFEPFSIAFETLQAIVVHGFQLLDIWIHQSVGNGASCRLLKFIDTSTAGFWCEWKGFMIRDLGFLLDMATLLTALGHYIYICWLRGMALHIVDVVLFLNIRALLGAIYKRVRGFIKLRIALGSLHAALPNATTEELQAYNDECAICREPMAKAKRLHCRHLFHLGCLRSWLDQGLNDVYSCPTCRKPLFVGRQESEANLHSEVLSDEQLARQLSAGLDAPNINGHPAGLTPDQVQNSLEGTAWRNTGNWLHNWPGQGLDGAGPSTAVRSVGLERVHMMMRHLASVGETYAQSALDDAAWGLWPMNPSHAAVSGSLASQSVGGRYPGSVSGLHMRTASHPINSNVANILSMAETVREVLPHVPDEIILQELQRTNSVTVTVNNLLQM